MSYPPFEHFNEMYGSTPSTPHPQQPQQLEQQQQQQQTQPGTPSAYPQWETIERDLEVHLHESPHDVDTTPVQTPTSTSFHTSHLPQIDLELEEHPQTVSSHSQTFAHPYSVHPSLVDNTPVLLHNPHEITQQQAQATLLAHAQQQQQYEYQRQMSHPGPSSIDPRFARPSRSPPSMLLASGSSSATGANPVGPVRTSTRDVRGHPYNRHSSGSNITGFLGVGPSEKPAESSGAASPAALGQATTGARARGKQAVRFSESSGAAVQTPRPATRRAASTSPAMPSPLSTGVPLLPSTAGPSSNIRTSESPRGSGQPQPPPSTFKTPSLVHNPPMTPTAHSRRAPLTHIPADLQYSRDTHILTASLEVPGVKRDRLRVTLGTAYFNKVRYVCVIAESTPVFDDGGEYTIGGQPADERSPQVKTTDDRENVEGSEGRNEPSTSTSAMTTPTIQTSPNPDPWLHRVERLVIPKAPGASFIKSVNRIVNPNLRERRFGLMRRVIQVPETTTLEDIKASLEDGVLTLHIDLGEPYELDDEVEVPIS